MSLTDLLEKLSAAAASGPWYAGPLDGEEEDNGVVSVGQYPLRPGKTHFYEDAVLDVLDNGNIDGDAVSTAGLLVELANAYRAGLLVPVEKIPQVTTDLLGQLSAGQDIMHARIVPPGQRVPEVVIPTAVRDAAVQALCAYAVEVDRLRSALADPPAHKFWGPNEPDCPREIRAGNGELHTLRCKRCGVDNPQHNICVSAMDAEL